MGRSYYLQIEMQLGGYNLTGKYPDQIGPDSPATTLGRVRTPRCPDVEGRINFRSVCRRLEPKVAILIRCFARRPYAVATLRQRISSEGVDVNLRYFLLIG